MARELPLVPCREASQKATSITWQQGRPIDCFGISLCHLQYHCSHQSQSTDIGSKRGGIKKATSPLSSQGPQGGEELKKATSPLQSQVPKAGRNQKGHITAAVNHGGIKKAISPLLSRGPSREESKRPLHSCCLVVCEAGRNQNSCFSPAVNSKPGRNQKGSVL